MRTHDYTDSFRVFDWECDCQGIMTIGALLRRTQQLGTDHCEAIGAGEQLAAQAGFSFFMAKLTVEVMRPICASEQLTMKTWAGSSSRASYPRLTQFYDCKRAEPIVTVDSRWVMVDSAQRRILRHVPDGVSLPFCSEELLQLVQPRTLRQPPLPQCIHSHTVAYHECDGNRHMNHTVYADLSMDMVARCVPVFGWVSRFAAIYHAELCCGVQAAISCANYSNGWYIQMHHGDVRCFEAQVCHCMHNI